MEPVHKERGQEAEQVAVDVAEMPQAHPANRGKIALCLVPKKVATRKQVLVPRAVRGKAVVRERVVKGNLSPSAVVNSNLAAGGFFPSTRLQAIFL
jgi:hypothetical protein